jgi:hypothetical protein
MFGKSELEGISGKLMGYSKTLCNRKENFCLSENSKKCNETSY